MGIIFIVERGQAERHCPRAFCFFPHLIMSTEATTTTQRKPVSKAAAKGNRPIAVVREKGCAISVYRNERTVEGKTQADYKFTIARTYKKGDDFQTTYAFRLQDLVTLKRLITDAREEVERRQAGSESEPEGE